MKSLTKKILSVVGTLVLGVGLGFLLWLTAFGGSEILKEKTNLPEKPSGNCTGFYYENLDDEEKIAYELIDEKIKSFPSKIRVPAIDSKNLSDVFEALLYDNPEYFFFSDMCSTETDRFGRCYFVPSYSMSIYEYSEAIEELEKVRDYILKSTSEFTDDYEKELYVHDYIVEKCEYVEKTGGTYSSVYGCLVEGAASCEGYAKAVKYLLDELEIENRIVCGTASGGESGSEGHAWNIVKINSEYYHLDATWDDPVGDGAENRYAYFNLTDSEISKTHNADENFLGECVSTEDNYYVKNSIYFAEYNAQARSAIASELARQARLGSSTMSFKMKNKQAVSDAKEALFDMNGIYSVLLSAGILTEETFSQESVTYAIDDTHGIIIISDFIQN